MNLTDYHAKYYAYELTRRCPSDRVERIASTLMDAQVDLNPHQVDAALFAFRSPLSKGALLADEVGLGKTIEAVIVLAQKWAEKKRKILLIMPSSLRKQKEVMGDISERNARFFEEEMDKLEKWAEDVKQSLEIKLKQLDVDIKIKKAEARKVLELGKKVMLQRQAKKTGVDPQ